MENRSIFILLLPVVQTGASKGHRTAACDAKRAKRAPQVSKEAQASALALTNFIPMSQDDNFFRSGNDDKDKMEMLDMAIDIIEIWDTKESPYNQRLQAAWMKRAREFGLSPSP